MSAEYSVGQIRRAIDGMRVANPDELEVERMLTAFAERIEADESAVPVRYEWRVFFNGTWSQWMRCKKRDVEQKLPYLGWTENVTEHRTLFTNLPAQAAQVDDKVVVIRDGQAATEGLVLAASIYMGAVKDIFALRSDGPPYNERKVTKDTGALRAFNHLDAATKALRQAIAHFAPTAEPPAQPAQEQPIPMILHCPSCGLQHIDAPETHHLDRALDEASLDGSYSASWDNPPHRSHLCHRCGSIWRPADVATTGVSSIETKGKADTMKAAQEQPGWKWVPVEPTPKMVDATWEHIQDKERSDIPESQGRRNKRIYAAMLAASPTPPKEN